MKITLTLFALFCFVFIVSSCNSNSSVYNFEELTIDHKQIAILPFEMKYTGNLPEDIPEQQFLEFEERTSVEFQQSLATQLINSSAGRRKNLRVAIQSTQETNAKLQKQNISIRKIWISSPQDLMKILNVDAVVVGNITYNRIMSEEASLGLSVFQKAARTATGGTSDRVLPHNISRSKEVHVNYQLINNVENSILWASECNIGSNYQRSFSQSMARANEEIACGFPYRSNVR